MLTPEDKRRSKLEAHGVPMAFLDAIDKPPHEDLEYCICYPEAFYEYFRTIEGYKVLQGYDVTPIYDCANGDSYWVLLSSGTESRFVHFELENDEIYKDYGDQFLPLLADTVIGFYEFADEADLSEIASIAQKIGLPNALELLAALDEADQSKQRTSFEDDAAWRKSNVMRIVGAKPPS